jgi:hypothetical protein
MSKVYVVHCIDTEGPLKEDIEATFGRLKEIFGIVLEPNIENLKKIQNGEINFGGQEDLIADAFAEKRISTLGDWSEVDKVLDQILEDSFRKRVPDSKGNGWIFNWFCLDHVGFTGKNPRRRDCGYGNIYNHYLSKLKEKNATYKDLLQFHYHPLPFNGHFNYAGTSYVNSNNLFEILAHRIIDNEMFPAAYRAGMEAERPDSHWFLEQWIPFDYSNDSYLKSNDDRQPDLRDGRYGDWRRASRNWKPYHPSHDDYQTVGSCHRMITRCVSLDSRVAKLELKDVREAFSQANDGKDAILAFANHDFRDMREEVNRVMDMLLQVSSEYPDVMFEYSDAISAFVNEEKLDIDSVEISFKATEDLCKDACEISINIEGRIFGSQPFFCFRTNEGRYYWDNLDYGEKKGQWSYVFDDKTINWSSIDVVALASNHFDGLTEIVKYDCKSQTIKKITKYGHRET